MHTGYASSKFADHLGSIVELTGDDVASLAKMPCTIRDYSSHQHILHKHNSSNQCCLLLQGYACWQDLETHNGQIISIYVPGDVPDIGSLHNLGAELDLVAVGPTVVAYVPHQFLQEISERSHSMSRALTQMILIDAALLRSRIINLASSDALTRVAHLLCEIMVRLRAVGLGKDFQMPMPFTQSDFASACGITAVHANRTIQALRSSGYLHWHSRTVFINDWSGLTRLAGFNPAYLHLRESVTPASR